MIDGLFLYFGGDWILSVLYEIFDVLLQKDYRIMDSALCFSGVSSNWYEALNGVLLFYV